MNSYKNHFYSTKKETSGDFNPGPISHLQSLVWLPSTSPPPLSVANLFIYRTRRIKNTIQKLRLYKFILVTYSHPHLRNFRLTIPHFYIHICCGEFHVHTSIFSKLPISKNGTRPIFPIYQSEERYKFSLPPGLYVETCTSFYVFSGPRWLTDRIRYWTPTRSHHRSSTSRHRMLPPPHH